MLALHARDDGRGAAQFKQGNGLSGMRERLAEFGGSVPRLSATGRGTGLAPSTHV